jgi:hypothetical protein
MAPSELRKVRRLAQTKFALVNPPRLVDALNVTSTLPPLFANLAPVIVGFGAGDAERSTSTTVVVVLIYAALLVPEGISTME